ncbi:MAG TPA: hypothetical protein VGI81_14220 [Tepidisphaeraceae bacterium]|jgi:hypothetical protein
MSSRVALPAVAFCLLLLVNASIQAAGTAGQDQLTIPDVGSIGTPDKGWEWKAVNEYDPERGGMYVCSAEGKPGKVILTIHSKKIEGDKQRIAALKLHFNELHQELQNLGATNIKGKQPDLTPPIPADVDYLVFGTTPKGATVYFAAHTLFKDHTFIVQAVAPSLAQAQKLAEVAKTLKNP